MAEYIEREAFLDSIERMKLYHQDADDIAEMLQNFPAADVRPVVRCRDCEYCRKADEYEYWCDGFCSPARLVRKDDFCSHGKAKE